LFAAACGSAPSEGRDEPAAQPGVEELLTGSFLPGPDEERTRLEHALAGELARTLGDLGGVAEARVHLSLADRSLLSRDRQAESKAAIVIRPSGRGDPPPADRLRAIAAAAVRGLSTERVEVFYTQGGPQPLETVRVGPLEVAAGSATVARAVLGGLLGVCLVLAAGLIYAGIRLRRMRR
jgi:type III secretory pathway lipoprotein EscJ